MEVTRARFGLGSPRVSRSGHGSDRRAYVMATNFKVGFAVAVPVPGDLNSNLKHRAALHRDRKYG